MKTESRKPGQNPAQSKTPTQTDRRDQNQPSARRESQGNDQQNKSTDQTNRSAPEPKRYEEQPVKRDQQPQGGNQKGQTTPASKRNETPIQKNTPGRDNAPAKDQYLNEEDDEQIAYDEEDTEEDDVIR